MFASLAVHITSRAKSPREIFSLSQGRRKGKKRGKKLKIENKKGMCLGKLRRVFCVLASES